MKFAKTAATLAATAIALTVAVSGAPTAGAATTPPYEPDAGSVGTITFYDAAGNVVTGGSIDGKPIAAYAVGSAVPHAGDISAVMEASQPNPSAVTGNWNADTLNGFTAYPLTTGPANIQTLSQTHPVSTGASTDLSLSDFVAEFPNTDPSGIGCAYSAAPSGCTNSAYQNLYQIRLVTANGAVQSAKYDVADVLVSGNTWTQVYPAPAPAPTATTTTLSVTPASPQVAGTSITLTATVAPAAAGTVQFKDGTSDLGAPATVSSGHASTSTTALAAGTHSLTAVFTPADSAAFAGSTSAATSYVVSSPAVTTTTTLSVTPAGPITVGTGSTLTATVAPGAAAGSVQFLDGATAIGAPVAVSGGSASTDVTFAVNTHSLKAVFTPTDPSAFDSSQSAAVSYTVNPVPATATTTTLGIAPGSPQVYGTPLTLTGTVVPAGAVGSVRFLDGATLIGTGTLVGGTATATTATLPAGTRQLTAQFVPTDPANFGTSVSSATAFTITPAASTVSLSVAPAGPVTHGDAVNLTATTGPAGAGGGTVQFFDGATSLGAPVAVASGAAHFTTTTLSIATHTLTAAFTPTSANYTGSVSDPASLVVNPPPPATTSTTLTVTPPGPVTQGTVETLRATVSPAAATGTVQFLDGTTAIGAPVTVSGGAAQTSTTLSQATHTLRAAFVSADPVAYQDSDSAQLSYLVKPPPTPTQTTLAATPSGTVGYGTPVTLAATVSPTAAGTVTFFDGATTLGIQSVSGGGTASLTTIGLPGGSRSLTAHFTPAEPLDFGPSTSSPATDLTVTAADTTTALAVTPAGPVTAGTAVTLSATITPATAVGSVTFRNGDTVLGTAAVSGGKAVLKTTELPEGTASLTASFAGTVAANFTPSHSDPVTLSVVAPPTVGSITVDGRHFEPGDTLEPGQSLTVHAAGFQPGERVEVVVHSAPRTLATVTAASDSKVTATITLPDDLEPGSHTLSLVGAIGTAGFTFTVAAAPAADPSTTPAPSSASTPGSGSLASTGADVFGGVAVGLVLLTAGLATLTLTRRRRGLHRG